MDLSWIAPVFTFLAAVPVIGPILVKILAYALPASAVATAIVALWHATIGFMVALAAVPGLSGLSKVATELQTDENATDTFVNTYVLGILSQLSLIPVPKVAAPVAKT